MMKVCGYWTRSRVDNFAKKNCGCCKSFGGCLEKGGKRAKNGVKEGDLGATEGRDELVMFEVIGEGG